MIPLLYDSNITDFISGNGIGGLSDTISCKVVEERNGSYELTMEYPISGIHFENISVDRIIVAKPNETQNSQGFRIYNISKPIDGIVEVNAEHISYQMNYIPVMPFSSSAHGVTQAINSIKSNVAVTNPFSITTDMTASTSGASYYTLSVPNSLKNCLIGGENSVIGLNGGEIKYDNYTVEILKHRGNDNSVQIVYGKNLTDLKQEENISEIVTGVLPYYAKDTDVVTLTNKIYNIPNASTMSYNRIIPVDITNEFTDDELDAVSSSGSKIPKQATFSAKVTELYQSRKDLSLPKVNLTVDFVNLGDTTEFAELKGIERVSLCDTVTVKFEKLGVNVKSKVVKTDYNTLDEKYNSIELSSDEAIQSSLSQTLSKAQQKIDDNKTFLESAIEKATKDITGNTGGYVVLYPSRNPTEILIMDTDSIATATNVWRWNKNGLGHSSTGYNGPFSDVAITADGHINGKYIAAGTIEAGAIGADFLSANDIKSNALSIADNNHNIVDIWCSAMTLIHNDGTNYRRVGFQNDGVFLGTTSTTNTVNIWATDGSADFSNGKVKLNADGSAVFSNGKVSIYNDGAFGNAKANIYADGGAKFSKNVYCEDVAMTHKGTANMGLESILVNLENRITALENKK